MVFSGLDVLLKYSRSTIRGKKIGVLCHAPSITKSYTHITDVLFNMKECKLSAIFAPQHGLYGETQDNMITWDSHLHPLYNIPVFSLYGEHRKPTREMLKDIDVLVVDLQDIGARLYTYIWTIKLCIEACTEVGLPILLLDRPNPIGKLDYDGPVLKEEFFTFVGGASIPLCHRMTIGEMTLWIKEKYYQECDLKVIWMKNWKRSSLYDDTELPWVLPSPNMPTIKTALVYPGTVLIEALNISEGRGTTIPFELFGAPFISADKLNKYLENRKIPGCKFRVHNYIPVFHKFEGEMCYGLQIHVTDVKSFRPVRTVMEIFDAIIRISPHNTLKFNNPPYEYECRMMPFDILSGDSGMRETLKNGGDIKTEFERWESEIVKFKEEFRQLSVYPEK